MGQSSISRPFRAQAQARALALQLVIGNIAIVVQAVDERGRPCSHRQTPNRQPKIDSFSQVIQFFLSELVIN
jgi:hypothetical protein